MKITTKHPASRFGIPVILHDDGSHLSCRDGIRAIRTKHNLSTIQIANACGKSRRTVEDWEQGRSQPQADSLNVLAELLDSLDPVAKT